jgi:hypothetical protein
MPTTSCVCVLLRKHCIDILFYIFFFYGYYTYDHFSESTLSIAHLAQFSSERVAADMAGQTVNTIVSQIQLINLFNFNVSLGRYFS